MGDLADSKGWEGEDVDEGQDIPVPVVAVVVAVEIVVPWLSARQPWLSLRQMMMQ
jgi:hypothetical protein